MKERREIFGGSMASDRSEFDVKEGCKTKPVLCNFFFVFSRRLIQQQISPEPGRLISANGLSPADQGHTLRKIGH